MSDGGYIVPVDNPTAAIIPLLDGLANLYAAATILQARGVDTLTGGSEDRSVEMYDRFFKSLKELLDRDLSRLGVGSVSTTDPSWRRLRTFQTVKVDGYSQANEY
jgi:hypothetical protein